MANHPFTADTTTPSLGASDLANIMGAGLVIGFGGLQTQGQTQTKPRRSLMSLLRKLAKKA
jgi:hypothetical protein